MKPQKKSTEWSKLSILGFIISLLLLILYLLSMIKIINLVGSYFLLVFTILGLTSLSINITSLIIAKKQGKKGAVLSILGILFSLPYALTSPLLFLIGPF